MRYAYQKIMFVISTLEQFFLFLTKIQFRLWEPETQWCVSALIADISSEVGLWKRESPRINKVKAPTDGMHRVLWKKKKKKKNPKQTQCLAAQERSIYIMTAGEACRKGFPEEVIF